MCTLPHIRRRDIMDLTVAGEKRGAGLILLLLLLAGPVVAQQQQVPTSRLGQHPDLMFFTQQDDRREDQVSDVAAFVEPSVGIVAAFRDTSTRTNISHGIAHHQEHYHQTEHIVKYQQNPELDASKAAAASPAARRGGESSAVVPSSATQDARLSTASDRPALSNDSARHSPPPSSRSDRRLKAVRGPVHRNEASRRQSEGRGVNVKITCTTSGCPSGEVACSY